MPIVFLLLCRVKVHSPKDPQVELQAIAPLLPYLTTSARQKRTNLQVESTKVSAEKKAGILAPFCYSHGAFVSN